MRVAVVGLGKMGSALARRLLGLGVEVTVWNRTSAAAEALAADGALVAPTLAKAWDGTDAVLTFLADDSAVRSVLLGSSGLLACAPGGGLLVEMSTISPAASAEVAEGARAAGVDYLRSPVSGNPGVLAAGQLTLIVSGDAAAFERGRELLGSVGATVHYVGARDEARTLKLAVNALLASTAQALAESVVLCEASGIDRAVALDVISSSAVGSPFVAYKREALLARNYEATFTTTMVEKDLGLVAGAADSVGVVLPLADLVRGLAAAASGEGLGDLDFMALLVHLQVLSGLPTDVPRAAPEH